MTSAVVDRCQLLLAQLLVVATINQSLVVIDKVRFVFDYQIELKSHDYSEFVRSNFLSAIEAELVYDGVYELVDVFLGDVIQFGS